MLSPKIQNSYCKNLGGHKKTVGLHHSAYITSPTGKWVFLTPDLWSLTTFSTEMTDDLWNSICMGILAKKCRCVKEMGVGCHLKMKSGLFKDQK